QNDLSASALGDLLVPGAFPRLRSLTLYDNPLEVQGIAVLARHSVVAQLGSLDLSACGMQPDGLRHLLGASLERLVMLRLNANSLGDEGARLLAQAPALVGLRTLELRGNGITDAGAQALGKSPYLHHLMRLDLGENALGDEAGQRLRERF